MLLLHYALEIRNGNTKDLDGAWCLYIDGALSSELGLSNCLFQYGLEFNDNRFQKLSDGYGGYDTESAWLILFYPDFLDVRRNSIVYLIAMLI